VSGGKRCPAGVVCLGARACSEQAACSGVHKGGGYGGPQGPPRIPPYHGSGGDCPGLGAYAECHEEGGETRMVVAPEVLAGGASVRVPGFS
jgi:hypothetical protein